MMREERSFRPRAGRAIERAILAAALVMGGMAAVKAAEAGSDGLTVSDAWFRSLVAGRPAGGYFTLKNDGDAALSLTGVSSSACGMTMLHKSVSENGVDKMMMVDHVDVPAHGSVSFAPGGYHVMCMKPTDAMKPGNSVPVTLKFSDGTSVDADFAVKSATGD